MNKTVEILDFARIFNQHKVKLYNYALKMTSDRMTAEDIVQNVFLSLYDNLAQIKKRESINYWLFRSARNEIYTYFRKKVTHKDQFGVDDTDALEIASDYNLNEQIERTELLGIIKSELQQYPKEQREIFFLREYAGLSYAEIAKITGADEELIKSRLFKIRRKLVKNLSDIIRK